jgi:hypothetical protein
MNTQLNETLGSLFLLGFIVLVFVAWLGGNPGRIIETMITTVIRICGCIVAGLLSCVFTTIREIIRALMRKH